MKMLSGLNKLFTEDRILQQFDRLVVQYKGQQLPFPELKAALKSLSSALTKNSAQLGTKPDHLAYSIWEACGGTGFFAVMDHLQKVRHLAQEHPEIVALLDLPVFANHEVMRAYVNHVLPRLVNATIQSVTDQHPGNSQVRWQLGFIAGDQGERPVLLMYPFSNQPNDFDRLEVGYLLPVGNIGTLLDQMSEVVANSQSILESYLADPAKWVSPERDARATQKELLTLIASLDIEQKALLKKMCLQEPEMLQQALAAVA